MPVRSYKPKGSTVRAIQFAYSNAEEVHDWVVGSRLFESEGKTCLQFPTFGGIVEVIASNWVVWTKDDGFSMMTDAEFTSQYEPMRMTMRMTRNGSPEQSS